MKQGYVPRHWEVELGRNWWTSKSERAQSKRREHQHPCLQSSYRYPWFFQSWTTEKKAMLEDEYNPEEHDSKHETQKSKLLKKIHHIVKFMKSWWVWWMKMIWKGVLLSLITASYITVVLAWMLWILFLFCQASYWLQKIMAVSLNDRQETSGLWGTEQIALIIEEISTSCRHVQ